MKNMLRVQKGWGYELWIHNDEKYCGKLLHFDKGKKCSLHYHKIKHETFFLQSGRLHVRTARIEDLACSHARGNIIQHDTYRHIVLEPGDKLELEPGMLHQMTALEESELFEFSTQHFDSDSYRFEKGD